MEFVEDGVTGEPDLYDEDAEPCDRQSQTSTHEHGHAGYQGGGWASPRLEGPRTAGSSAPSQDHEAATSEPTIRPGRLVRPGHPSAHLSQQPTPPGRHTGLGVELDLVPALPYPQAPTALSNNAPRSPTDRFIVHDDLLEAAPSLTLTAEERAAHPHIYRESTVYPLQNKQEAILLRHFIQNLAIWVSHSPFFLHVSCPVLRRSNMQARPVRAVSAVWYHCASASRHLHGPAQRHLRTLGKASRTPWQL